MILAVITTCKRAPAMVERALKSVIAQTYTNWDCLVVDDSPAEYELRDEVRKMVEGYAAQDKRIHYLPLDRNYGAQRARNIALEFAGKRGYEFIGYLDDDDEWLPEKLEKQRKRFAECGEKTGVVCCKYYCIYDDENLMAVPDNSELHEGYVYDHLMASNFTGAIFPLARVKCLADVGGFDEEMVAHQDYDMWLRASRLYEFACINEPLGKLHRYDGDHIWSNMTKPIAGRKRLLSKNKEYFMTHKDAYCTHIKALVGMYMANGQYTESFKEWLELVSLQPFKIIDNVKVFIRQFMIEPMKLILKRLCPALFIKLRYMKHKLKGAIQIDTH